MSNKTTRRQKDRECSIARARERLGQIETDHDVVDRATRLLGKQKYHAAYLLLDAATFEDDVEQSHCNAAAMAVICHVTLEDQP